MTLISSHGVLRCPPHCASSLLPPLPNTTVIAPQTMLALDRFLPRAVQVSREPLQFDGEKMWAATCKTFWDIFWQKGFAAVAAADMHLKLPVMQKLKKLGQELQSLEHHGWHRVMMAHADHMGTKEFHLLQQARYRKEQLQGATQPGLTRRMFVQDTSPEAVQAVAETMKRRLAGMGMQTTNFGEQLCQRQVGSDSPFLGERLSQRHKGFMPPYTFADFAFSMQTGWTLPPPLSPRKGRSPLSGAVFKKRRTSGREAGAFALTV